MRSLRSALIWTALLLAIGVPLVAALMSPLLEWRDPVYKVAGFAGVVALAVILCQPLLAGGFLPGLTGMRGRRLHRVSGGLLFLMVVIHVVGLWVTSPPDVIDALLFDSPTPFSLWGVIAMWAVFLAVALALLRRRLSLSPRIWRVSHKSLVVVVVVCTVVHALQIDGTMELITKWVLCLLALAATATTLVLPRIKRTRTNEPGHCKFCNKQKAIQW